MAKGKTAFEKPTWLKLTQKDIEATVIKLAKQGLTSEKIGLELRDAYGIPTTRVYGEKISEILKRHNLNKDSTMTNLEKKQGSLIKHLEKNKQDKRSVRALTIISARMSKLKKYKKRKNVSDTGQD